MVGDNWLGDVMGAVNAGIRAVWFNRRSLPCPDLALATEIRTFEPVEPVIEALLGVE